jgi:ubiquinone/menaquinone biosynthesis C-methylase UbiE
MVVTDARVLRSFTSEHGEAQEEIACPLCGSTDAKVHLESKDALYDKPGKYRVMRCKICTLPYVSPRPTLAALGAHYPEDYMCYQAPEAAPKLVRGMSESIARNLTLRRLGRLETVIGRIPERAELADVGCGLNDLLVMIKNERGPVGTGIDFKPSIVKRIQDKLGMPAVQGTLADAKFASGQLDVVTMLEYLEHEPNPGAVLAESRRVLKKGGHVAIEIPHAAGWPARFFGSRWSNLDVPRHLVFFDPQTLGRALSDHGFELVSYQPFTVPFHFGISIVFALGGTGLGRNPLAPLLAAALGTPFLPFLRWLPEFAFAVGRAV